MKKKLAYFMACSDNIIFAAGNVALQLNKYMPDKDFDIVIYHSKLQENNKKALQKINHVVLRDFSFDKEFSQFMLSEHGLPNNGRWKSPSSLFAAAHFEIFNLLNEYETVIWLDVDISIQGDISELEKFGPFGIAKDLNWNKVWKVKDQFIKPILDYDMNRDAHINAVIVVNDKLKDFDKYTAQCYALAKKWARYLKNLDQAVFEMLFQDNKIITNDIPWNDFVCHAHHQAAATAKIVHFGCAVKPWTDQLFIQCYPEWFRTHLRWLELGGDDFDRSNISTCAIWFDINRNYVCKNSQSFFVANANQITIKRFSILKVIPIFSIKKYWNGFKFKLFGIPLVYYFFGKNKSNTKDLFLFKIFDFSFGGDQFAVKIFKFPIIIYKKYLKN